MVTNHARQGQNDGNDGSDGSSGAVRPESFLTTPVSIRTARPTDDSELKALLLKQDQHADNEVEDWGGGSGRLSFGRLLAVAAGTPGAFAGGLSAMALNAVFYGSVAVGGVLALRKLTGYFSNRAHSGAFSVLVGVGDLYNLQSDTARVHLDIPTVVGRRRLRRLLNLHSSRCVMFQVVTRKLGRKGRLKTYLTANAGPFVPLKNGMLLENGGGKDPIRVADAFDTLETREAFERKFSRRVDYSSVLVMLASAQGGTGGGFLHSRSRLISALKRATGANLAILVMLDTECAIDVQNENVGIGCSRESNFRDVDLIVNIQQSREMDQNRNDTNKIFAPLLAALTSPNSPGDDLSDIVRVITKPNGNKMLTVLDLGDLAINTEHAARHLGKAVLNHKDELASHFHVQLNQDAWVFEKAQDDESRRAAALLVLRPAWAQDIDHEIAQEVESKLGLTVADTIIKWHWRRDYARAFLLLSPKNGVEASCIRSYSAFPAMYDPERPTAHEEQIIEGVETAKRSGGKSGRTGGEGRTQEQTVAPSKGEKAS